jgi:hypothetical protein
MNRTELIDNVKSGRRVTIMLNGAEVVSAKKDLKPINHYTCATLYKIVVKDPIYGAIFFSGFSEKMLEMFSSGYNAAQVSLKVTVTGVGESSDRYPDPILFAKPHLKKGDPLVVDFPIDTTSQDHDLSVNV